MSPSTHRRAFSCTRTVLCSILINPSPRPAAPSCSPPGTSTMEQGARAIVYWPGMSKDIHNTRAGCVDCNRNAPSQAATPPTPSPPPSTPFEAVFADVSTYGGQHYLVVGDRLSGWVEVFGFPAGTTLAGAAASFAIPVPSSSHLVYQKNSPVTVAQNLPLVASMSSAHFSQSNGRAEVAVKTAKRLPMSKTGPTGSLDHDRFVRAILQLRNTPDHISPAQIIFDHIWSPPERHALIHQPIGEIFKPAYPPNLAPGMGCQGGPLNP